MKHRNAATYRPAQGPSSAPAYYQGRPASLWINVMKPCRGRTATDHLAGAVSHD